MIPPATSGFARLASLNLSHGSSGPPASHVNSSPDCASRKCRHFAQDGSEDSGAGSCLGFATGCTFSEESFGERLDLPARIWPTYRHADMAYSFRRTSDEDVDRAGIGSGVEVALGLGDGG